MHFISHFNACNFFDKRDDNLSKIESVKTVYRFNVSNFFGTMFSLIIGNANRAISFWSSMHDCTRRDNEKARVMNSVHYRLPNIKCKHFKIKWSKYTWLNTVDLFSWFLEYLIERIKMPATISNGGCHNTKIIYIRLGAHDTIQNCE